jgi:CTP-dependent riboflavin kinase
MDNRQVYQGIVRTGRGAGAGFMSAPGVLGGIEQMVGLSVLPGTLNAALTEPFNLSLLDYVDFARVGLEINLAELGIDYQGEPGVHYGRITIAGEYPGIVLFFTWVDNPGLDAELVSPHHLRDTLGLSDGDTIEFTLARG